MDLTYVGEWHWQINAATTASEWDQMFRFRLGNMERLWGVISDEDPRVFYPIWWDPLHKVCPSKDK